MDKKYITFIFIFAAALIVGTMIDQGTPKNSLPNKIDSVPPSIPSQTRVSLASVVPTKATVPTKPAITAEPAGFLNPPTNSSSPSTSEYLFTDSFDQTYKPDWRRIEGDFITVDNHFVATSGRPARVIVGSPTWTNYEVEGIFEHLANWTRGYNDLSFGIRTTSDGKEGYFIKLQSDKIQCVVKRQNTSPQVQQSKEIYLTNNDTYQFLIRADGTKLSFWIDDEEVCAITDASFASGLFYVEIDPGDSGKYPYIDDIRIREL